jgi:hypothetical protein
MSGPAFVHAVVSLQPSEGVVGQLRDEALSAEKLGIQWQVLLATVESSRRPTGRWTAALQYLLLRVRFYWRVARLSRSGRIVLLRHSAGDAFQYVASLFLRPYYTVHHTFEEAELAALDHPWSRIQIAIEGTLGRRCVARAAGLICVTGEIAQHELERSGIDKGKPIFIYPNGIRLEEPGQRIRDERGSDPEVLFVAGTFYPWHGLEALLESLLRSDEGGLLHIVGNVPGTTNHMLQGDSRVRLHGQLAQRQLQPLYLRSWLGLSSFRLADKNMHEACTLKAREYLSKGVPVYAGHRDSGLPNDFAYFRQGPADWSNILATAREFRTESREMIVEQSRPYIDKSILLTRLHESLAAVHVGARHGATARR